MMIIDSSLDDVTFEFFFNIIIKIEIYKQTIIYYSYK